MERLLAALYGLAMALLPSAWHSKPQQDILQTIGRTIHRKVFQELDGSRLIHLMARDYARHSVDAAMCVDRFLQSAEVRQRLRPEACRQALDSFGIEDDRNPGQYRNGTCPIDLLDDNPIHRLRLNFAGRRSQDRDPTRAKQQLWWRIYDLGYSVERFGQIDALIAISDRASGGDTYRHLIKPYGKKYADIATLELAGAREDAGLLDELRLYPGDRLSFADIDPSFSAEVPNSPAFSPHLLLGDEESVGGWILASTAPDIADELIRHEDGNSWILLHGYAVQEEASSHRASHVRVRSYIIAAGDANDFLARINDQDASLEAYWAPRIPSDAYRFSGEVPRCETFPENGWSKVSLVGTEKKPVTKHHWFRSENGVKVELDIAEWHLHQSQEKSLNNKTNALEASSGYWSEEVEELEEFDVLRDFSVLVSVREDHWESYHSATNEERLIARPCREITSTLQLRTGRDSLTLNDQNGAKASLASMSGDLFRNGQKATYLRQDLMDSYLSMKDYRLIWVLSGERRTDLDASNRYEDMQLTGLEEPYRPFLRARMYVPDTR